MDNAQIADRLDALASLLELAEANPYTARAYRRAAETVRNVPTPVTELVQSGRVRDLRGVGPGIEARLRELVDTGQIAELTELERELAPDLVGLGRYLGLGARRSVQIAHALGVRTADELRAAAAEGRLRTVPGIGPKTEAQLREALAQEPETRTREGLLLNRARELVDTIAAALDAEAAGDVRRWRDSCEHLAVVRAAQDPGPVLARFAELPQIVALIEQDDRRALGVTVEGVPIELVTSAPERFGTALLRATGAPAYVDALEPLPDAPDEATVYRKLKIPWCPPELREAPFADAPPALVELQDIRGDLHSHTTWSDGRASVEEMAAPAATAATSTWRSATTPRPSAPSAGSRPTTSAARPRRSPRPTRRSPRSASCAASNATSTRTAASTSPTTSWPSSTGSRPACTAASACPSAR